MTENDSRIRKDFIEFILNEILIYFGLDTYTDSKGNTTLIYRKGDKLKVINNTIFERLLEFCGIRDLAFRYMWMPEVNFFEKLTECKYFNFHIFGSAKGMKDLHDRAKEEGLESICRQFIIYLSNNAESLKNKSYIFTKHENMHIKAIDWFFGTSIEETLSDQYKYLKEALISHDKIREYIQETEGLNTVIYDYVAEEILEELKDLVSYKDGGMMEYLQDNSEDTIKEDVQHIFKYYVGKTYS